MMKKILIFLGFLPYMVSAQQQQLEVLTDLTNEINESSSLINIGGKVFTVNDSGGEAFIYEMDTITGEIARSVSLVGGTNVDWESLTYNSQYVYVGDIGNNAGTRQDLKYYRIHLADLLTQDEVIGQIIHYKYEDQMTYFSNEMNTPWDAEATIVSNDTLYLFTKNWTESVTDVYTIPATPGNHIAHKIATIPTPGLITDATINSVGQIVLSGYDSTAEVFIMEISKLNGASGIYFNVDEVLYLLVPTTYSRMVEGICKVGDLYYLSAENIPFNTPGIYKFQMASSSTNPSTAFINENAVAEMRLYPNPATNWVAVEAEGMTQLEVYNVLGNKVLFMDDVNQDKHTINTKNWTPGVYIVNIEVNGNSMTRRFVVE